MDDFFREINFPYPTVREGQGEFIKKVSQSISEKKNIMVSAPTGLGKTISGLAPAIHYAKKNNLSVIYLTSRQTQANQAIKTIMDINRVSKEPINYVAFIGKRSMCVHPERDLYPASDFNDFCKKVRETGKCKFFKNAKNDDNFEQIKIILDESSKSFMSVEGFVNLSGSNNFCPYELAGVKAHHADVLICDFNYMFSGGIRENFLGKVGRQLEECILVVDEAHNLPDRVRNAYSFSLSTELIKNALKELSDFIKSSKYDSYIQNLQGAMEDIYFDKLLGEKKNYLLSKKDFSDAYISKFSGDTTFSIILEELAQIEALVKEERVISYVGRVASFIESWLDLDEESFLRTLEKDVREDKTILSIKIKCIDPSDICSEVVNKTYSTIMMSGTLSPIGMYKDILGVENTYLMELESPFLKENQLTMVVEDVTTKYSARSIDMYRKIAKNIESSLLSAQDKNALVFFPSYDFMERILSNMSIHTLNRKILREQKYMTKEKKEDIVADFRNNGGFDTKSKVLFGITSGSFSEGLDLPDDALEMVIIVGLPLGVPDLFTEAVIKHFDKKFHKGQFYGYIYPAISKIVQAAGRCIRTETDRGVVILMDNRFLWPLYAQCFPKHWKIERTKNLGIDIANFFNK